MKATALTYFISPSLCLWFRLPTKAFQDFVLQEDPSLITGFEVGNKTQVPAMTHVVSCIHIHYLFVPINQVGENLRDLQTRADCIRLKDYGFFSRRKDTRVSVKAMQTYSAKWAKTKTRISATSNQESTEVRFLVFG